MQRKVMLLLCVVSVLAGAEESPPPMSGNASANADVAPFVAEVDANGDGCMSREEWEGAGAPISAYEMLHDETGCVTARIMATTPGPSGVDLNSDGQLTLDEMKAFDRKMTPMTQGAGGPPK